MSTSLEYASFLIRLWREHGQHDEPREWQGEVEHIQSGQRWTFNTLDEMLGFLRRQAEDPTALHLNVHPSYEPD